MGSKNSIILGWLAAIGAAVVVALVVLLVSVGGGRLFYPSDKPDARGYTADTTVPMAAIVPAGGGGGSTGMAKKDEKPVDIIPYIEKADLKLGAQLLNRCKTCHTFEKGKPGIVGPNQYGLVGRVKASMPGFAYSDALKAQKGTWDFQSLSEFLTSPQAYAPGTRMAFAGLARPEERAAVIQYINQNFSDAPLKTAP